MMPARAISGQPAAGLRLARLADRLWRGLEPVLVWSPTLVLGLPLAVLMIGSFAARWDSRGLSGLSLSAYHEALALGLGDIGFSAALALVVMLSNLLFGVPLAYFLSALRFPGRALARELVGLPVVLPPMILSMSLILAFPGLLGGWEILYLGHVIWTLPYMVWPVMAALSGFDRAAVGAAARTLGASEWTVFRLVILPNLRGAAGVGAVLVFIISFAEINGSLFLGSAQYRPVGVALMETFMNLEIRVAAAFTMIFLGALAFVFGVAVLLGIRRHEKKVSREDKPCKNAT